MSAACATVHESEGQAELSGFYNQNPNGLAFHRTPYEADAKIERETHDRLHTIITLITAHRSHASDYNEEKTIACHHKPDGLVSSDVGSVKRAIAISRAAPM